MIPAKTRKLLPGVAAAAVPLAFGFAYAQQGPRGKSSYMQVEIDEPFSAIFSRLSAQKPEVTREHMALLNARYDLSNRPAARGYDGPQQAGAGRGSRQASGGNDLGGSCGYEPGADSRAERVSQRILSVTPSEAFGRRLRVSALPDRRDQTAGGTRSYAFPCRV